VVLIVLIWCGSSYAYKVDTHREINKTNAIAKQGNNFTDNVRRSLRTKFKP